MDTALTPVAPYEVGPAAFVSAPAGPAGSAAEATIASRLACSSDSD